MEVMKAAAFIGKAVKRALTARTIFQIFGFLLRFFVNMPNFLAKNEQKAKKNFL